tara:strand:+ start:360 stop:950 length:591 start_codon:yes stop_codon:yes gene_type:complete
MNKKVIIQLLLLIVLFGIIISVFFLYFNKEKNIKEENKITNKAIQTEIDSETGTLIKDINYSFSDPSGNYYELFSELGEVDISDSDKMLMTNVVANIYLKNSATIKIVSKYANYNKIDHETNFFENVEVTHLIHKANSENLDISFKKNIAIMYNNVVYNKPGTQLIADRLEIDLISKNTKILMDNKSEKIKIIDNK